MNRMFNINKKMFSQIMIFELTINITNMLLSIKIITFLCYEIDINGMVLIQKS